MGSPLVSALANIFLDLYESKYLNSVTLTNLNII